MDDLATSANLIQISNITQIFTDLNLHLKTQENQVVTLKAVLLNADASPGAFLNYPFAVLFCIQQSAF